MYLGTPPILSASDTADLRLHPETWTKKPINCGTQAGADGRVEIGYMVVSEHRRHGYAEEAVRALMAWAAAEQGITRFRASISPQNTRP